MGEAYTRRAVLGAVGAAVGSAAAGGAVAQGGTDAGDAARARGVAGARGGARPEEGRAWPAQAGDGAPDTPELPGSPTPRPAGTPTAGCPADPGRCASALGVPPALAGIVAGAVGLFAALVAARRRLAPGETADGEAAGDD